RTATIRDGQHVNVTGTLVCGTESDMRGSYRDSSAPVLRRTPGRPMIISSESVVKPESRAARRTLKLAFAVVVVFFVLHATLFLQFDALRLIGRVVTASAYPTTHTKPSPDREIWPVMLVVPGEDA